MRSHLFTKREEELIRKLYQNASWEELKKALPGRTRGAIMHKAHVMNLFRENPPNKKWAASEIKMLRKYYPRSSREQLLKLFTGKRTWHSINRTASRCGIRRFSEGHIPWTREELRLLVKHFPTTPRNILAKLIPNHTWNGIALKGNYLGLSRRVGEQMLKKKRAARLKEQLQAEKEKVPLTEEEERLLDLVP